jgi:hypothetical protein
MAFGSVAKIIPPLSGAIFMPGLAALNMAVMRDLEKAVDGLAGAAL